MINIIESKFNIKILNKLKLINFYATGFVLYTEYYLKQSYKFISNLNYYYYFKKIISNLFFFLCIIIIVFFFLLLCFLDSSKQLAVFYIIGIVVYILFSNFNIFLKKYSNGKFTSANQRFWKRTNIIFWLIEGFLFSLFFFYYLNSSQEPLYMFDYSSLNQEYLLNIENSIISLLNISFILILCFIVIIKINNLSNNQIFFFLIIINLFIFYMFLFETYQFFYLLNIFVEKTFNYNSVDFEWELESNNSIIRVKQQYLLLCLVAKYWHFIFIFISWFFFLSKYTETYVISYNSLGYNIQNLIILYFLNIIILVQWLKIIFKKFFENIIYCFYTNWDLNNFFFFLQEFFFIIFFCIIKLNWLNKNHMTSLTMVCIKILINFVYTDLL